MSAIALVQATFPDAECARDIAEGVVEARLAACANILAPCTSIYRWEGEVERAEEVPVLFKTTPDRAHALRAAIVARHPYALPVVEAWVAETSADAARWLEETTA